MLPIALRRSRSYALFLSSLQQKDVIPMCRELGILHGTLRQAAGTGVCCGNTVQLAAVHGGAHLGGMAQVESESNTALQCSECTKAVYPCR